MGIFGTKNFDLISIGDIVVDDFIKIKEAEIEDRPKGKEICFSFGDKIPYESETLVPAVGNSPNAAVSAARLGLKSALLTNLGRDENGARCIESLNSNDVDTEFVITHREHKTNYHFVLWYGDDRTILIKHENYPYQLPELGSPKWIYLSSLGEHSLEFHDQIFSWLEQHPETKLAFQPGTYQLRFGPIRLAKIYRRSEFFFCNREEARRILDTRDNDIRRIAERIADIGPKYVFITDGREGAYLFKKKERTLHYMPIYPDPKPPVERTGAGDSFSSTVTACALMGIPPEEAMKWGMVNSMSVVQHVGAQAGLLTKEKIRELLAKAPADFGARLI